MSEKAKPSYKDVYIVSKLRKAYRSYGVTVYSREEDAIKECQNEDKDFSAKNICELDEFLQICGHIDCERDGIQCTRYSVDIDSTSLYLLQIENDDGGQSYGTEIWHQVSDDKEDIIDQAMDWYEEEHNREDEDQEWLKCSTCSKSPSKCKMKFIKRFMNKGGAELSNNYFANIYKIDITTSVVSNIK